MGAKVQSHALQGGFDQKYLSDLAREVTRIWSLQLSQDRSDYLMTDLSVIKLERGY